MSTGLRGVKFHFEPGEHVLCFEPDCSKARVLYEAKILDLQIGHTGFGKRYPEYQVHFQGWNSSWDRLVPESFILKNSESNRALMRRLTATARHVRSNKMRRRRIDMLLQHHFRRRPQFNTSDSDTTSSSDASEDDTEQESELPSEEEGAGSEQTNEEEDDDAGSNDGSEDVHDAKSSDNDSKVDDVMGTIDIDIPKNLCLKLEDDCYFINCQNKLVRLPAETNVLTILEAYLKNYAVNQLCATERKQKQNGEALPSPHDNIAVGKEIMDSLRILFDFTLPKILLYDQEREQYETHIADSNRPNSCESEDEKSHTPRATRSQPKSTSEPPAKVARTGVPPKTTKKDDDSDEEVPARRMTRHSFAEELKRAKSPSAANKNSGSTGDKPQENGQDEGHTGIRKEDDRQSREGGRRRRCDSHRSTRSANLSTSTPLSGAASPSRSTPPPTSLAAEAECSTTTETNTDSNSHRETAVGDIFSWQLVPSEALKSLPVQPSTLYGAQHLLRLFVKLPDVILKMRIPANKLPVLTTHMELLLQYISDRCEELLPDSSFIDV